MRVPLEAHAGAMDVLTNLEPRMVSAADAVKASTAPDAARGATVIHFHELVHSTLQTGNVSASQPRQYPMDEADALFDWLRASSRCHLLEMVPRSYPRDESVTFRVLANAAC